MSKNIRFIICAAPRTGSNMLSSLLNAHKDILCHHELFNPNDIFYALNLRNSNFSFNTMNLSFRNDNPLVFLKEIWSHPLGHSHVGFKMTHYQNTKVFDAIFNDKEVLKIVLKRKNKVKTYVSKLIAEKRNLWEDYGEKPLKKPNLKVHVNANALLRDINYNNTFYQDIDNRLKLNGQTAFYCNYESLTSVNIQDSLLRFLGCKIMPLTTTSRKQNTEPLKSLISNYQDLKQHLFGTALLNEL